MLSHENINDEKAVLPTRPLMPAGILPLSAKSPTALKAIAERLWENDSGAIVNGQT